MRSPQVLVYERGGHLARLLEGTSAAHGWSPRPEPSPLPHWLLREPRRPESCLRLLRGGGPNVLVLHVGTKPEQELLLLGRVHWLRPETAVIVVGDEANDGLAGLAWDLGACYVLLPPQSIDLLPAIVAHWMSSSVAASSSPAAAPVDMRADVPPEAEADDA